MRKNRLLTINKNFIPLSPIEGDEIYAIGIFHLNITRISDHIKRGILHVKKEKIFINEWFKNHFHGSINEDHLPTVDITKPVLKAEIRPEMFSIIDGNHRIVKAYRESVPLIHSYKIKGNNFCHTL